MSGSILIIENDTLIQEALTDMFSLVGLDTIEVQNGRDAITAFHTHHKTIDLVILDMRLPDMDGSEILPELEAIQADVRVIVTSGEEERKLIRLFKAHPNVTIVPKPYDIDVVLDYAQHHTSVN